MSTVNNILMSLLSGIDDPEIRVEVMRTVYFLQQAYASGAVDENQIRSDLKEICETIIKAKDPLVDPETLKMQAEELAERILEAFRLQSSFARIRRRLGFSPGY